uniref:Putative product n=1 Tax=Xenopsylla cheopis TaxID=163159 RepID=A0A6M2DWE4_XENCH
MSSWASIHLSDIILSIPIASVLSLSVAIIVTSRKSLGHWRMRYILFSGSVPVLLHTVVPSATPFVCCHLL